MDSDASTRLDLTDSEAAALQAASRIYAAEVAAGRVSAENQEEKLEAAACAAIKLAGKVDRMISADEEVTGSLGSPSSLRSTPHTPRPQLALTCRREERT